MSDKPTPSKADQWTGSKASRFDNKAYSEYYDPCQEAADKSIRCLKRNGGERAMCSDFFHKKQGEKRGGTNRGLAE
ncbi:hypothetical protein ACET3X_008133 [Alternaria dauci]|uniref:Uncharacterized protein n=1 Tax=Alternaria dauci TaxID=48095 RepID=A0ABR3U9H4_9PLEO